MHRSAKSMDGAERDPKYKRRLLYIGAAIYGYGLIAGVAQVLSGDAPPAILLAAPIPLLFVWFYLRAVKRVMDNGTLRPGSYTAFELGRKPRRT